MKAREIVGRWKPTYTDGRQVKIYRTQDGKIEVDLVESYVWLWPLATALIVGIVVVVLVLR